MKANCLAWSDIRQLLTEIILIVINVTKGV